MSITPCMSCNCSSPRRAPTFAGAKARLADATLAYRRGRTLSGTTVSAGEVARRLSAMQETQNAVRYQQAAIDTLTHRLEEEFTSSTEKIVEDENSVLIAPFAGVVSRVDTAVADDIAPADIVVRIVTPSNVWIAAFVRPDDVSRLEVGSEMRFLPLGADKAELRTAKIRTIEGTADPETGLVRVIATFDDPGTILRPGTQLDAWLSVREQVTGMIVPTAAVQRVDGHPVVYKKVGDDRFEPVPVQSLLEEPDRSVLSGKLTAADDIVAQGSFSLKAMALLSGLGGD